MSIETSLVKFKRTAAYLAPLLRYVPELKLSKAFKIILAVVLILNIRAFPFVWHIRVFAPLYPIWAEQYLLRVKTIFKSHRERRLAFDRWIEKRSLIGRSPFEVVTKWNSFASIDESDYNFHLSNSSYAKILDGARFKMALQVFLQFFRSGGKMALAGTHTHFIREIPILAKYEVRLSIGAWDEKWIYIVCRFVTKGKGKKKTGSTQKHENGASSLLHAPIDDTNSGGSSTSSATPLPSSDQPLNLSGLAAKLATEELDGATLHTISISQMCFKHGRITVPPAVAFATSGLSVPPVSASAEAYSHSNLPPHYQKVQELLNRKGMAAFYKGGWRSVPEEERWWGSKDGQAMGGIVEEMRKERIEVLGLLKKAMEGSRDIR